MSDLRGITWNHTRGFLPMLATAQRFSELHPETKIHWEKRSLQEFADLPIEKLADTYDLLVIDHPFSGYAAAHDVLLPLDTVLMSWFLQDQAAQSVGGSHKSYNYGGHQWALAIDAATPVCGYRPDLLERAGAEPPRTWEALLELADKGLVAIAATGLDSLMNFYMLCGALGEEPFLSETLVVDDDIGLHALQMLAALVGKCDPSCKPRNPIATWDILAASDSVAICPFAYGYSNYARTGYGTHTLEFGALPVSANGKPFRSTLGGAGLAISSQCKHREEAVHYCEFVAEPAIQRTIYFDSGGQPGHRQAWLDPEVNRRCNGFFRNTLPTLDEAWLRPRYDGYLHFQDAASVVMQSFVAAKISGEQALICMNQLYMGRRNA